MAQSTQSQTQTETVVNQILHLVLHPAPASGALAVPLQSVGDQLAQLVQTNFTPSFMQGLHTHVQALGLSDENSHRIIVDLCLDRLQELIDEVRQQSSEEERARAKDVMKKIRRDLLAEVAGSGSGSGPASSS